jgi:hypothetical protein
LSSSSTSEEKLTEERGIFFFTSFMLCAFGHAAAPEHHDTPRRRIFPDRLSETEYNETCRLPRVVATADMVRPLRVVIYMMIWACVSMLVFADASSGVVCTYPARWGRAGGVRTSAVPFDGAAPGKIHHFGS